MVPTKLDLDLGGTIRSSTPRETLDRLKPLLSKAGISRVANVTGLDTVGVPTWMVVRPKAKSLTVSQGKGLTHELALASGIMESLEMHHAETFVPASWPAPIYAFRRNTRYINPVLLNIRPDAHIDELRDIEWIRGRCLMTGVERFIPREVLDLDFRIDTPRDNVFVSSSNGLASGNTRDEAVLHALCEVVERDQLSFWHVARLLSAPPTTRLDLDTVDSEFCLGLIAKCKRAGLNLLVWSVTRDIDVPAFICTVTDEFGSTPYHQRASGSGCHPKRGIALCRAITEALQSRLTHICGIRDDAYWSRYLQDIRCDVDQNAEWLARSHLESQNIVFSDIFEYDGEPRISEMISFVVARLQRICLADIIVVDLEHVQFGIPVVYVCVPGLEFRSERPTATPGIRMERFLQEITQ